MSLTEESRGGRTELLMGSGEDFDGHGRGDFGSVRPLNSKTKQNFFLCKTTHCLKKNIAFHPAVSELQTMVKLSFGHFFACPTRIREVRRIVGASELVSMALPLTGEK